LGRDKLKISINFTFRGGFAVDADFTDGFSGSIEGPIFGKNDEKSINFNNFPGGGVRAQAQCFLWGLFFDKSYSVRFRSYKVKNRPKNSRTVGFFQAPKLTKSITF
jgi:hypothetical protein